MTDIQFRAIVAVIFVLYLSLTLKIIEVRRTLSQEH